MPSLKYYLMFWNLATIIGRMACTIILTGDTGLTNLPRDLPVPENVTNYINWMSKRPGTSNLCEGEDFTFFDDTGCNPLVWDCEMILIYGATNQDGSLFELWRQWDEGNSTFATALSFRSCTVQVAMLNGTNAIISVRDLTNKVSDTIQRDQRQDSAKSVRPSYGKMWCPGPPPESSPLDIGVEWMIGCNSGESMSITSLPELPVL